MELNEILQLNVVRHDLNTEVTIRQYFYDLLSALWVQGENFSSKRPFGNSGWDYGVYVTLIREGLISGKIAADEDGGNPYVDEINEVEARNFVINNILKPLFGI